MATTERGEGAYHNIMAELYATDIPGFTNFMRMTPEFFEMIKTRLEPRLARQATNYRAPISVGEKLALTIRYLATGESYTSLSCQFRVGRSTISKFLPQVCRAIQDDTWLMKPYGRRMLTREERIANYRISRGRRVVENAFGILVSRLRVMMTTIELPLETVRDVVMTCVVLHNILRSQYQGQHGAQQPGGDDDDDDVPGTGRLIGGAADGGRDRNPAREAKRLRDYLKDYFNNEGAVAWQDDRI